MSFERVTKSTTAAEPRAKVTKGGQISINSVLRSKVGLDDDSTVAVHVDADRQLVAIEKTTEGDPDGYAFTHGSVNCRRALSGAGVESPDETREVDYRVDGDSRVVVDVSSLKQIGTLSNFTGVDQ